MDEHRVALLEYYTTPSYSLVFLVKKDLPGPLVFELRHPETYKPVIKDEFQQCAERLMIDFHGLPENWEQSTHVQHFKNLLSLPPTVNAIKRSKEILQINLHKPAFSYELGYWEQYSQILLPEELRRQIVDCELLCFIPHGPLHLLPFAALRWSSNEYLVERFGICYAPSASVLRYCQSRNRKRTAALLHQPRSCLVAAVAAEDDHDRQKFEADHNILEKIFKEKDLSRNVTALIGAHHTQYHPAAKSLIKQEIGKFDIVHLACHGIFSGDRAGSDALDSGLLLSDGESTTKLADAGRLTAEERSKYLLTAREILELGLTTDLVTLRACSSGRAEVRFGDELMGLTRAFLYAGAPSLIVSLWNVNIDSSRMLLEQFYRCWLDVSRPLSKWRSFQEAQISLLRDPGGRFRHPYHWAAFALIGDWI